MKSFHKFVKMQKRPANTLPEIDKFDKGNRPKMVPVKSIYLKLAIVMGRRMSRQKPMLLKPLSICVT